MRLRWTPEAADDLESIADYLFDKAADNAARLILRIYLAPSALKIFPSQGRTGRISGTRELTLPSLPYVIVYKVSNDAVHILRILHGARQWPS